MIARQVSKNSSPTVAAFTRRVIKAALVTGVASAFAGPVAIRQAPDSLPTASPTGRIHHGVICGQMETISAYIVVSDKFSDLTGYNTAGAADCTVKSAALINEIDTIGAYYPFGENDGPADSVNVTIYRNEGGKPGRVVQAYTDLPYTDPGPLIGALNIKLKPVGVFLTKGTYFISVQANIAYGTLGEWWGWNLQIEQLGLPDQFIEDGNWGTGCTNWGSVLDCTGVSGDFMFQALGAYL